MAYSSHNIMLNIPMSFCFVQEMPNNTIIRPAQVKLVFAAMKAPIICKNEFIYTDNWLFTKPLFISIESPYQGWLAILRFSTISHLQSYQNNSYLNADILFSSPSIDTHSTLYFNIIFHFVCFCIHFTRINSCLPLSSQIYWFLNDDKNLSFNLISLQYLIDPFTNLATNLITDAISRSELLFPFEILWSRRD